MLDSYAIYTQANDLVKQCGTRDPGRIARELGILVLDLEGSPDLLGMYTFRWNHRIMLLNQRLYAYMKNMVMAHELGHDQRHRNLAKAEGMKEFTLFNMKDTTEYEANAFASHILLDSDEIYSLARQGHNVVQIAQMMNSDINLVLIKLQEMSQLEYKVSAPMAPNSRFFKNIKGNELPKEG